MLSIQLKLALEGDLVFVSDSKVDDLRSFWQAYLDQNES